LSSPSDSGVGSDGELVTGGEGIGGIAELGGAEGGVRIAGLGDLPAVSGLLVSLGVLISARGGGSFRRLIESFRGATRSTFRGGTMGSRRIPGLMSGAGTRLLSVCNERSGSIGGRFRSGGFSSATASGVGSGVTYGDGPFIPFLVLGRRLFASSLLAMDDAATESWLLLLDASLRSD
jgi:hypothetical protein